MTTIQPLIAEIRESNDEILRFLDSIEQKISTGESLREIHNESIRLGDSCKLAKHLSSLLEKLIGKMAFSQWRESLQEIKQ